MPSYTTALETTWKLERAFGADNYQEVVRRGGAHAVELNEPEHRDWENMETLCGKPTHGMTRVDSANPADWPQARHRDKTCPD